MSQAVRVKIGSESYIFDRDELTLTDLYAIKSTSTLDANDFFSGIMNGNPTALQTLVWFCRHKAGVQGDRLQIDFKLGDFDMEPVPVDPTPASSSDDAANTSEDSPTSAI